ncbi:hypothetical protein Q9966_001250 [Columba livia]|nr:hypothetical protein Q9966_001250 [Columba livia]
MSGQGTRIELLAMARKASLARDKKRLHQLDTTVDAHPEIVHIVHSAVTYEPCSLAQGTMYLMSPKLKSTACWSFQEKAQSVLCFWKPSWSFYIQLTRIFHEFIDLLSWKHLNCTCVKELIDTEKSRSSPSDTL